ncbi:hypothetical protein A8713_11930 [Streptomyces sp. SAT1]|uniref:hypothetical protein n=1 Tax=Streptomyces sp. SAT1 TaxID=1849967 RepID=UPI0007DD609C|nr:hypothetical protein [Streptomyces sp. SAT1]ANH91789.1 hypothetical protein A8713_11930 [Streptomyces sp. SAT1]
MQRFTDFEFGVPWVMGFFHADGSHSGDTPVEVVANHFAEEADQEILAVRRDALTLLDGLAPEAVGALWSAGAEYLPGAEPAEWTAWTRTVVALCDARLSAVTDPVALSGADLEDGRDQEEAVVAEIAGLSFLAADVRDALTECARRGTPDLAFRILLRVLRSTPGAWLAPDRYARMEAIGAALRLGEFVVDSVQYLVDDEPPPDPPTERFTDGDFGMSRLMRAFAPEGGGGTYGTYGTGGGEAGGTKAPVAAVRGLLAEASDPREVLAVRRDAQALLDHLPGRTGEVLWCAGTGLGPGFFAADDPGRASGKAWLRTVVAECDARLSGLDVPPLDGGDLVGGGARNGPATRELSEFAAVLDPETAQALTDCAWLYDPELALRLLLRTLVRTRTPLTAGQYARLAGRAAAYLHGPRLLEDVRRLVPGNAEG